jgi:two-component system response regulator DesR
LLPRVAGLVGAAVVFGLALLVGTVVEGGVHAGDLIGLLAMTVAMIGMFGLIRVNSELRDAREELARLAVTEERERIARDLHDVLGHSLTTITVKAALARRLLESGDTERATTEVTDVERLGRQALADVRSTVAANRVASLAAEVAGGEEAKPDVALLDVQMPGCDGIEAAARLNSALPSCRVVILTTFGRPGYLSRAMRAGASGFVVKDSPPEQLADAVRRVHSGLRVVDPVLAAESLSSGSSPLTSRQHDVLREAADGATVADLALRLHLSEGTVRNHLSSAIGKTGARTRAAAVKIADEHGWL